jgi:hypothetical protein
MPCIIDRNIIYSIWHTSELKIKVVPFFQSSEVASSIKCKVWHVVFPNRCKSREVTVIGILIYPLILFSTKSGTVVVMVDCIVDVTVDDIVVVTIDGMVVVTVDDIVVIFYIKYKKVIFYIKNFQKGFITLIYKSK